MGNWNISIKGVGVHHNKSYPDDANRIAAECVAKLRAAGHSIASATITYGGDDNLEDPTVYLDDRDAIEGVPEDKRRPRCGGPAVVSNPRPFEANTASCRLAAGHRGVCLPPVTWA